MRLIDAWTFELREFDEDAIPEYAILSHTWADGEVTYAEMQLSESVRDKPGFTKIARAAELAAAEDLRWVWVDTCCIDKSSSAELQEAINSSTLVRSLLAVLRPFSLTEHVFCETVWRWYSNATVCYVFMSDVPKHTPFLTDKGAYRRWTKNRTVPAEGSENPYMYERFTSARWFTRGWCLQELIAPKRLLFYCFRPTGGKCKLIGDKSQLLATISQATNIDPAILEHKVPLCSMSVAQRMSWAANRQTRRVEDQAYSLLGIFDVSMPMLYGEGKRAFMRLQEEIMKANSDHSLFAWGTHADRSDGSLLAASPADFAKASHIVQWGHSPPFEMTNRGLRINLKLLADPHSREHEDLAILNCRYKDTFTDALALRLKRVPRTNERYVATTERKSETPASWTPGDRRICTVHVQDLQRATSTDLLISRTLVRDSAFVRMIFHLNPIGAASSWDYIKDIYTEQDVTIPGSAVFTTTQKAVSRAGVMLQYPSGRQFSLVFGFDRYPPNDSDGVLLPGIWARFHRGPQKLKEIIKLEAIHPHGRDNTCKDPRVDGCPYMPKSASVSLLPEGDCLDAYIKHERMLDEDVLLVRADITQIYELEADPLPFGEASASKAQMDGVNQPVRRVARAQMMQASFGPFVPDVRHGVSQETCETTSHPQTPAKPLAKSPQLADAAGANAPISHEEPTSLNFEAHRMATSEYTRPPARQRFESWGADNALHLQCNRGRPPEVQRLYNSQKRSKRFEAIVNEHTINNEGYSTLADTSNDPLQEKKLGLRSESSTERAKGGSSSDVAVPGKSAFIEYTTFSPVIQVSFETSKLHDPPLDDDCMDKMKMSTPDPAGHAHTSLEPSSTKTDFARNIEVRKQAPFLDQVLPLQPSEMTIYEQDHTAASPQQPTRVSPKSQMTHFAGSQDGERSATEAFESWRAIDAFVAESNLGESEITLPHPMSGHESELSLRDSENAQSASMFPETPSSPSETPRSIAVKARSAETKPEATGFEILPEKPSQKPRKTETGSVTDNASSSIKPHSGQVFESWRAGDAYEHYIQRGALNLEGMDDFDFCVEEVD